MVNSLIKRFSELPIDAEFRWHGEPELCRKTDEYSYIHYGDDKEIHKTIPHWQKVQLLARQHYPVKQQ